MQRASHILSTSIITITVLATLSACDAGLVIDKTPRQLNYLQVAVNEPAGANCMHGGQKISIGFDDGYAGGIAGNGQLDPSEVRSHAYACNGVPGPEGTSGTSGYDGLTPLAVAVAEPAGDHCTYGGQKISTGFDDGYGGGIADNGKLDPQEVRSSAYACHGAAGNNGTAGTNGLTPLVIVVAESPGLRCTYGGQKISTGFDDGFGGGVAGNGQLDPLEVRTSAYACNGAAGTNGTSGTNGLTPLVVAVAEAAGTHCTYGGQKISTGFDDGFGGGVAGNGQLDPLEVRTSAYACNGAAGTSGTSGTNGLTPLVVAAAEAAGTHCTYGGQKISTGFDDGFGGGVAGNGQLDPLEVRTSAYACNGAPGAPAFELAWLEGSVASVRTVTARWTPASVESAHFVNQIVTSYSDNLCTTVVTAGQTLSTYGQASTSITFPADGTFYFKVATTLSSGSTMSSTCSRNGIRIDTLAPTSATALSWLQGASSYTNSITAQWTKSAASDLGAQTLLVYTGASCNTLAQTISDLGSSVSSRAIVTAGTGWHSFKIVSSDTLGNSTTSACSASISIAGTETITITGLPTGSSAAGSFQMGVQSTDSNYTHYAYVALINTTSCPSVGYGSWIAAATTSEISVAALPDGPLTICVLTKDSSGNVLPYTRAAYSTWLKNTSSGSVSLLLTAADKMIRGRWTAAGGTTIGYIVIRRSGTAVNWTPSDGSTYSRGDGSGDNSVVANLNAGASFHDLALTNGTNYHYSIYGYDAALSYIPVAIGNATPNGGNICNALVAPATSLQCADPSNKPASNNFAGGAGTSASPYVICSAQQLNNVRNYLDKAYTLGANLDLGTYTSWTPINAFSGRFNGSSFHIDNLTVSGTTNSGLFGTTSNGSKIENLVIKSGTVAGTNYTGAVVGIATGTKLYDIVNCAQVSGDNYQGGIVGEATSTSDLRNLFNAASVSSALLQAGGIAGRITGSSNAINLLNSGGISGATTVGGTVGYAYNATLNTLINSGSVFGTIANIGGVLGQGHNTSTLSRAENYRAINLTDTNSVGGIVGSADHCSSCAVIAIDRSSNHANITARSFVGGVVGYSGGGILTSSRNTATITGTTHVGGVLGFTEHGSSIDRCVNQGPVTGDSNVGGILGGSDNNADSTISNAVNSGGITGVTKIGGIIGFASDIAISTASNSGVVSASGDHVGGIYGQQVHWDTTVSITSVTNTAPVTGRDHVGGIAGNLGYGTQLSDVTNTQSAAISGTNKIGGIVGRGSDNGNQLITNASNAATVSGTSNIGGIVGLGYDMIFTNASNSGAITGTTDYVGGIVGNAARWDNSISYHSLNNSGAVSGGDYVGGIAGYAEYGSSFNSCTNLASATINGTTYVGGIVGRLSDNAHGSFANNSNAAAIGGGSYVGGISGFVSDTTLTDNTNSGSITASGNYVGGLLGNHARWDSDTTSTGNINNGSVSGANYVGGLFGFSFHHLNNNTNNGNVSGIDYVAGIAGTSQDNSWHNLTMLTNTGNIQGNSRVAGIFSYISDSNSTANLYNTGNVTGTGNYVAGIIAILQRHDNAPTLTSSYNLGRISGASYVGGIVGYGFWSTLSNVYNTGNVFSDEVAQATSATGGIIGYASSVWISSAANLGNVRGKLQTGGIIGLAINNHNLAITVQEVANSGLVSSPLHAGGIIGELSLTYAASLYHAVNLNAQTTLTCTTQCGAIRGAASGALLNVTSSYAVNQSGTTTNSIGTKVDMTLTDFNAQANFLASPPLGGTGFSAAIWNYELDFGGQTGLAWLFGMQ